MLLMESRPEVDPAGSHAARQPLVGNGGALRNERAFQGLANPFLAARDSQGAGNRRAASLSNYASKQIGEAMVCSFQKQEGLSCAWRCRCRLMSITFSGWAAQGGG